MRTRLMTASLTAFALAGTLGLNAQTPQTQPPSQPGQPPSSRPMPTDDQRRDTASGSNQAVTVSGCLKAEKDVPGHSQGSDDNYVLTNVKMGQGSATSAMGLATMYEVKGVSDAELKKHVNHQVEITGTLERGSSNMGASGTTGAAGTTGSTSGAAGSTSGTTGSTSGTTGSTSGTTGSTAQRGSTGASGSSSDLPDLRGTSVKMVAATCSAQ